VRQRQLRVGIRGDFSFATFSLHGRQRKVEENIVLLIQQP
jgi:hypothetical protein